MKNKIYSRWVIALLIFMPAFATDLQAQVPQLINYQGHVAVNGVAFEGVGQFKFALVNTDGTAAWWANSSSASPGGEPTEAVRLTVVAGVYAVLLGDTSLANMSAIPAGVFTNAGVRLRVWFNDGMNGSQLLTPDQLIAAASLPGIGQSEADAAGIMPEGNATNLNAAGFVRIGQASPSPPPSLVNQWQQCASEPASPGAAPSARWLHTAVWSGSEMIIWGGIEGSIGVNSGGRFNPALNTWTPTALDEAPTGRHHHTAVWANGEMIVWGGFDSSNNNTDTGGRYNPVLNSWRSTQTLNAPTRRGDHTAIWTGTEMIIWGGVDYPNRFNSGGRYNPSSDTWRSTETSTAPEPRETHTAIWTGSEMIVWGGYGAVRELNNGGRYNPVANSWLTMPTGTAPVARTSHAAVWTGTEMIVWGGTVNATPINTGGRYNPSTDSWTATPTGTAPSARELPAAVWTGTEMIVWGGWDGVTYRPNTGGRYNPAANTWTATTTSCAPAGREFFSAVWTGTEMIVWGGSAGDPQQIANSGGRYNPSTDTWVETPVNAGPRGRTTHTAVWTGSEMIIWGGRDGFCYFNTGGRYNPAANTWTPTANLGAPSPRYGHTAVWANGEMVVWGGFDGNVLDTGGRYDPVANTWRQTSTSGMQPSARYFHTAVWTGSRMIVWGGERPSGMYFNDVGRYDPVADSWTPLSTAGGAPTPRAGHTAVWTGSKMVVWGGANSSFPALNDGGRYDPVNDNWLTTSTVGPTVPGARRNHVAVWTGSEMVVWGGQSGFFSFFNTGGRYNPVSDTWRTSNTSGAPTERASSTAIWTGTEMIVWGGEDSLSYLSGGGRYNPGSDSWRPTSNAGEPSGRTTHTAVWTGREMIVWGGYSAAPGLDTGGRYDPVANTWATVVTNVIPGRSQHTAVWTGTEMIVWGGVNAVAHLSTGGRYDPVLNNWIATPIMGAPAPRRSHTAVWTGTEMIVWGGRDPNTVFNTGGRYNPAANTWAPTDLGGAPIPRQNHTAIWTGKDMIIWGGSNGTGTYPATVGRYNPLADLWTLTNPANPPSGRERHVAVWTGTEMVVWAGFDGSARVNTGGRYNPVTDNWRPTSTGNGAPTPRLFFSAVWTGTEMIVWGGQDAALATVNTGGRYDPVADTWVVVPTGNAPSARRLHTAVWSGREMIVFGGWNGSTYFDTGGRYDPAPGVNSWTPTPAANTPTPRNTHTAVWTCREMIVHGGFDGANHLDTLWKYQPYASVPIADLFNTGVNAAGMPVADNTIDLHYSHSSSFFGFPCVACEGDAWVATSAGGFPIPPWLGDNSSSAWISPSIDTTGDSFNNHLYHIRFDLTGMDPTTAIITGRWATDDVGLDILINAASTGQRNTDGYTSWTPFQITRGFVAGRNVLSFVVDNRGGGPTGVRVEMSGAACQRSAASPPPITRVERSGCSVTITWASLPGYNYRVQYTTSLGSGVWNNLPGDVAASGFTSTKTDTTACNDPRRFYRIVLLP